MREWRSNYFVSNKSFMFQCLNCSKYVKGIVIKQAAKTTELCMKTLGLV